MEPEESWEYFGCFTYADSQWENQRGDWRATKKNCTVPYNIHGGTGDHKDGKNVPNFGEEIKRLLEQQVRKYDWFFNPRKFL